MFVVRFWEGCDSGVERAPRLLFERAGTAATVDDDFLLEGLSES